MRTVEIDNLFLPWTTSVAASIVQIHKTMKAMDSHRDSQLELDLEFLLRQWRDGWTDN